MLTRLIIDNLTAFDHLALDFSPGINLIIGNNSTGKTHILKYIYSTLNYASSVDEPYLLSPNKTSFTALEKTFLITNHDINKLIRNKNISATWEITEGNIKYTCDIQNNHVSFSFKPPEKHVRQDVLKCLFIPSKEILSNAPGFRSLYKSREVSFAYEYYDLLTKAYLPYLRTIKGSTSILLNRIGNIIGGKVTTKGDKFYLENNEFELEFNLFSEGLRKFALLWILLRNGVIPGHQILLWDEPESNINPMYLEKLVEILLTIEQMGVQIFIATHSYALLREFNLQKNMLHKIKYINLYKGNDGSILSNQADDYDKLENISIEEHNRRLYDLEVQRVLGNKE